MLGNDGLYETMKAFVQDVEIDPLVIGPPTMNYGQHQRCSQDASRQYRYEMSVEEFLSKIGDCFEKFRLGEIEDVYDEANSLEFPELFNWRSKGYPSLESLVASDPYLLVELIKYWEYDISHAMTEFASNKPTGWIVMSIDDVVLSPNSVNIFGTTYDRWAVAGKRLT